MIRRIAPAPWYAAGAAATVVCLAMLAGAVPGREALASATPETRAPAQPPAESAANMPARRLIPVDVLRVIDGDTVEVRAHIWLDQSITTKVRLRGIDAPEFRTGCTAEAAKAASSRDQLAALTSSQRLHLTALSQDKFGGRVLADLITPEGQSVAQAMLSSGHARAYATGKRHSWC